MSSIFCSSTLRQIAACTALIGSVFLAGCGAGSGGAVTETTSLSAFGVGGGLTGKVHGGQSPIFNAAVRLYAVGYTGYGSGSTTAMASTTSDVNGNYSLNAASYSTFCTANPSAILYVTAIGGNTQGTGVTSTNNAASALMAVAGTCSTVSQSTTIIINELTTAASVVAMAPYMNPGTGIGGETIGTSTGVQSATAIATAAATLQNLVSVSAGAAIGARTHAGSNASVAGVTVTSTPETAKLITIANILAACVNQTSSAAAQCADLMSAATPPPVASVTSFGSTQSSSYVFPAAVDTIQAALYMEINPIDAGTVASCHTTATTNVQCLYNLASTTPPFQTGVTVQPTDWTLGVTFTATGTCSTGPGTGVAFFNAPTHEAVDASGNLWFVNGGASPASMAELSPAGVPLACLMYGTASNYAVSPAVTANGTGIAIDPSGNVWAAFNGGDINGGTGVAGLVEVPVGTAATATAAQPWPTAYTVYGMAIDGSGDVLMTGSAHGSGNFGGTVYELPSPGATVYTTASATTYAAGATYSPTVMTYGLSTNTQTLPYLAVDHAGNFFTGSTGTNTSILGATNTTLAITGYAVTSANTVVFYTSTAPPASFTTAVPEATDDAAGSQNFTVSGFAANADPNAVEMNQQGFSVTAISTTAPYSVTGVLANPANGLYSENASIAAVPTLTTTSGTITDAATLNTFTGTTAGTGDTATIYTGYANSQIYTVAVDGSGYVYEAASCCNVTNPGQLGKIAYGAPVFASPALSHTTAASYLGGMNGARAIALDGAGNVWTGNLYPESGTTATLPVAGNYYAVSEIATSGGSTAGSATFTALSPTGSLGTGVCSSNDTSTTVAPGCPVNGGFQKASFLVPYDLAIDPSGNVWVPQTGYSVYSSMAGTSTFTFNGTSITEMVGAAVPQVTPMSVAAGTNTLTTKPAGGSTPQTISFTPPASTAYGTPVTLSATASSGLPVTFTVASGPATVSGNTLTPRGVGTVVVTATQTGSNTYQQASTSGSLTVTNPNPQTVPASSTAVTMTVAATYEGTLPSTILGLKFPKSQIKKGYFATNGVVNQTTLQFFKTVAPNGGTLGLGQGNEDSLSWNPTGTGEIDSELTSTDTANLAAFMKALGNWKLIYGINLGGMAPTGYTPALVGNSYPTSSTQAAQEVVSLVQALGTNWSQYLEGVEIGNEPDLDQWHESHAYCAAGTSTTDCGESGTNDATTPEWTLTGTAPYGFEPTWESLHTAIVNAMAAGNYGTLNFVGPDGTNIYTSASSTQPSINNPTAWTYDFGADKGSELSMLTMHYYPFSPTSTVQALMQASGIDPVMIGPNSGSNNPTQPAGGILNALYNASATTTTAHAYGFTEANSIGGGGTHLVSDAYAAALWNVDFILSVAQGDYNGAVSGGHGGAVTLFTTGGPFGCTGTSVATSVCSSTSPAGNYYSPIYDNSQNTNEVPLGVLPVYYGMMLLGNYVSAGNLYLTTLSTGGLNVTGYSVYNSTTGALDLIVLNKDASDVNIKMTATVPASYNLGSIFTLTQGGGGTTIPNLSATPVYAGQDVGITIQGGSVNNATGAFTAGTPNYVAPSGNTVSFYVPPLSAVVVQLTK